MISDEAYMQRCIQLALLGLGNVRPNPMVGAVVVHNGTIIGEGYHEHYGEAHAEVNAIRAVKNPELLSQSTVYVSLEPCAHHGKTPPCADLLIRHQVKKVVIGCVDSFSEVSGKGIQKLQDAGIEVVVGVLEADCRELNKRFFTFHEKKRPYVILKWAQSKDGFMDRDRSAGQTGIHWITQPATKRLVHRWRSEEAAILVGRQTALNDDPSLTVREWVGNNPTRILLDASLEVPEDRQLFNTAAPTIVLNTLQSETRNGHHRIALPDLSVPHILAALYKQDIQSVIVEGGARVLQSFLESELWDEARVLTGTGNLGKGLSAPKIQQPALRSAYFGEDLIHYYKNT